jgi:hypothetical protein
MEIDRDQETWRREHRSPRRIRSGKDLEPPDRRQGGEIGGRLGAYPGPQQRGHGAQGGDGSLADAQQSGGQPWGEVGGGFSAYAAAGTRQALAAALAVSNRRVRILWRARSNCVMLTRTS